MSDFVGPQLVNRELIPSNPELLRDMAQLSVDLSTELKAHSLRYHRPVIQDYSIPVEERDFVHRNLPDLRIVGNDYDSAAITRRTLETYHYLKDPGHQRQYLQDRLDSYTTPATALSGLAGLGAGAFVHRLSEPAMSRMPTGVRLAFYGTTYGVAPLVSAWAGYQLTTQLTQDSAQQKFDAIDRILKKRS